MTPRSATAAQNAKPTCAEQAETSTDKPWVDYVADRVENLLPEHAFGLEPLVRKEFLAEIRAREAACLPGAEA